MKEIPRWGPRQYKMQPSKKISRHGELATENCAPLSNDVKPCMRNGLAQFVSIVFEI